MIDKFLQYLQYEKNYSPHTVLSYHNDIDQFCRFMNTEPRDFKPEAVSATDIQQWVLALMSLKDSPRTLSRKISALRSFWRFMLKGGITENNPMLKIVLPKTNKPIPSFFKQKEMNNALDTTFLLDDFEPFRNHVILKIFYATGIRLSELILIKDTDVDLVQNKLTVTGKGNKQRVIPLVPKICPDIQCYIELRNKSVARTDPNLFVRKNGKKMYPKLVYNIVHSKMTEVSSLAKRSPHVLRHTFATAILNEGADINMVKELLGHSSLAATQVYTHTSFEELHKIYNNAHPRAK